MLDTCLQPIPSSPTSEPPPPLLQNLWDSVSYGIFVLDVLDNGQDFCYTAFNPTIARTSPIPVGQLLGKTLSQALPESIANHDRDRYRECVKTQQPISFETHFDRTQETTWLLTVNPIGNTPSNPNTITQLLVTAVDISDRKQPEAPLQQPHQLIQQILDTLPILIFWKDRDSVYQGLNQSGLQICGLSSLQDAVGKTDYDMPWTTEESDWYRLCDRRVMDSGQAELNIVETQRQADGRQVILNTNKVPLHDTEGNVTGILVTIEDISDRKFTEAALAASEAKFRRLVEDAHDVISTWDLNGILSYVSPSAKAALGYDPEEMIGQPFAPILHPDDLSSCLIANQKVIETGETQSGIEFRCQHIQGYWVWMSMNMSSIKDSTGNVIALQGILRDINDRKQQEDALRFIVEGTLGKTGKDFLHACVKSLAEISQVQYAFITELVDETYNKSRMLALWTGTEIIAPYEFDLVGTPCRVVFQENWGIFPDSLQATFPTASALATLGAESYLAIVITDSQGKPIGNLGIIDTHPLAADNLTSAKSIVQMFASKVGAEMERHASESALQDYADRHRLKSQELEHTLKELQHTQSKMVQSEKMSSLGQLVAGIAHEINNPVNFIHGNITHASTYTKDLLDLLTLYQQTYPQTTDAIADKINDIDLEFLSEDLSKVLESMKIGSDRIREIVKSLRLFSRLDESEVKPVNIHDGIDSTLMILQNRLKEKSDRTEIKIIKNYSKLPEIECFAGQLNQVFMNILTNSIDALEESQSTSQPTINISTELHNNRLTIRFTDNGVGIPEAIQAQIFDPFFTTKPVGKGTGMGMSISYQIITEKHGGQLSCQSTLGQGTEFTIQIPTQQAQT